MTAFLRNSPNAPEMMSSELRRARAVRPVRKPRTYSIAWQRWISFFGALERTTRSFSISAPLSTRTIPPAATMRSSSTNGLAMRSRASEFSSESASMQQKSG